MKKRVLIYCQHVLGMGHLIRSMAIAQALKDFDVYFLNGGEALTGMECPPWMTIVQMPAITSDGEFEELKSATHGSTLEAVQQARRTILIEVVDRLRPDVLLIELFPFGRKRFAFELLPLLAHIRLSGDPTKIVCSLRDILVKKSDQARHEDWVVSLMNRYFDLLLIHADPTCQTLDETFSRLPDIRCLVRYTGFVTQEPEAPTVPPPLENHSASTSNGKSLILLSIGGGRVGYELIEETLRASCLLETTHPHRILAFTGPYMPEPQYQQLQRLADGKDHIEIRRFTPSFQSLMKQAALSISMAGYNTCMNLLTTGTRALVFPFTGRGNEEQTIRAKKLERLGLLTMLEADDLYPDRLAAKIADMLAQPSRERLHTINTNGSRETAILIKELTARPAPCPRSPIMVCTSPSADQTPSWLSDLRNSLASHQAKQQDLHLFLRNDDVDVDEEPLRHLLDIALARNVPVNLAIIPGRLTAATVAVLKNALRADPSLFSLNQHGWLHVNHEPIGRRCEFGPARSPAQQIEDIARGKAVLAAAFADQFFPVFTPPWNRCTVDTYAALDELGFSVLSKDQGTEPLVDYRFREFSTTLDLFTWKGGATMKAQEDIVRALIAQMRGLPVVGLLLHHKVMNAEAFRFLDQLLSELTGSPVVRFHTFQTLVQANQDSFTRQKG